MFFTNNISLNLLKSNIFEVILPSLKTAIQYLIFCFIFLAINTGKIWSQQEKNTSSFRHKNVVISKDTIILDSLSIAPGTFKIHSNNQVVDSKLFEVDYIHGTLIWKGETPTNAAITYRVFNLNLSSRYFHKDTSYISHSATAKPNPFRFTSKDSNLDLFGMGNLDKSGSISRGVMFGNNQDLSINSNLNLQLSGKITNEVSILASVSDDNLPIQPEGNTQQLQDFDQVYIQLFTDSWKITAGDFWMNKPNGYFLKYNKRAQGGSFSTTSENIFDKHKDATTVLSKMENKVSAAISKGKFGRNVIQGIEGNQGPYKLIGAENEQFIIVLSGTEMVYIDGKLLTRGQENDYVIDYNTAEITFTPKQLITKDKRITVEFQYSDKNYARSVIESTNTLKLTDDWKIYFNIYSEQDSKNQPLQQDLRQSDKDLMFELGDNLMGAVVPSADSVPFSTDQVLYKRVDSLGYTPVYVHSSSEDSAFYQVFFSEVGQGNGSYIEDDFSAFGRVYKWVAPDTIAGNIVLNGTHEPVRVLIAPKKRQMINFGVERTFSKYAKANFEVAYSNLDQNTFSPMDAQDNQGYAILGRFKSNKPLTKNQDWKLLTQFDFESQSKNFNRIERFREVEFERNWNVLLLDSMDNQYAGNATIGLSNKRNGSLKYSFNSYLIENMYTGLKNGLNIDWHKHIDAKIDGSYLISDGSRHTSFLRHKATISKQTPWFRVGFKDEHEQNLFSIGDSLLGNSYQFYDWEVFVQNPDSSINQFRFFYKERTDQFNSENELSQVAHARNPGFSVGLNKNKKHRFELRSMYRILEIKDSTLTSQKPDNTLLNRLEYQMKLLNGAITANTFYEVGSGLELRKEFTYIEVPAGQGVYTWIDYNDDGVKDIQEFEVAAFPDQATYIRVFTPSNDYIKVFSNQFSEVININPKYLIKNKKGIAGFVSRFNSQTSLRTDRKTSLNELSEIANPFLTQVADTSLQSLNSSIRQSTFFNRSNPKFGMEHTFLEVKNKVLLVNGFDSRERISQIGKIRWNITRKTTLQLTGELEQKNNTSEYAPTRNYRLNNQLGEVKFTLQPGTTFRVSAIGKYQQKLNAPDLGGEQAYISDFGLELKYNQLKKGALNLNANYVVIAYNGATNSSLAFEMLEALQPGNNITWNLSYQRTLANNLQLTLNYTGRKTEENPFIHTGGVQVRAFF